MTTPPRTISTLPSSQTEGVLTLEPRSPAGSLIPVQRERRQGDRRQLHVPVALERRQGERRYTSAELQEASAGIAAHLQAAARPGTLTAQERNMLVEQAMPLVRSVLAGVSASFPRHADREELGQAAMLGLVEAAHRFDPARGVPFQRWVALRIRGSILDAARALDFAPRSLRAGARTMDRAALELEQQLGRTPTEEEIASEMGVGCDEVARLRAGIHGALVLSLDAPVGAEDEAGMTLGTGLADIDQRDPLAELELREHSAYVRAAVELLPERLRDVVCSYFLEGETSAELAARLRVTESRVSQLRSEALSLIRDAVAAQYAEEVGELSARLARHAASVTHAESFAARLTRTAVPACS